MTLNNVVQSLQSLVRRAVDLGRLFMRGALPPVTQAMCLLLVILRAVHQFTRDPDSDLAPGLALIPG